MERGQITEDGSMTNAAGPFRFEVAGRTDTGLLRAGRPNQDAFEVRANHWTPGDLFVDRRRRHGRATPAGDLASLGAVAAILEVEPGDTPEATSRRRLLRRQRRGPLDRGRGTAHVARPSRIARGRPGTTLVVAYLLEDRALVANVGDSRTLPIA